jgi:hypothetical protein
LKIWHYNFHKGDNTLYFVIQDPWPVNEGAVYIMSYSNLCDGRIRAKGDGVYPVEQNMINIWVGFISYDNDTIPPPDRPVDQNIWQ